VKNLDLAKIHRLPLLPLIRFGGIIFEGQQSAALAGWIEYYRGERDGKILDADFEGLPRERLGITQVDERARSEAFRRRLATIVAARLS